MQKQALKGLFFNISTCFSPHLAAFLTGEYSLMFFHLPAHSYHQVRHAGKNLPHTPPFAYIIPTICLYNIRCTLSAQSPLRCAQLLPFCSSTTIPFLSNPCKIGKNCITL